MGIALMFMLLATITPYLFILLKKKVFAIVQSVSLVGMWIYFLEVMFQSAPAAFSITWSMFYLSLVLAEVAWVMFIIQRLPATFKQKYQ
ncbi:hypothetical protein VBD025_14095 [Virgibacillus flavescens]|uniref:hypothetical protein n=1 Tax=Virgibacillus flavescens TaxID=1611422 RepID=UPI003D351FE7